MGRAWEEWRLNRRGLGVVEVNRIGRKIREVGDKRNKNSLHTDMKM